MKDPDEHHPGRGDPLGEVDVGARRIKVIVVGAHPADDNRVPVKGRTLVALPDGILLEPDCGRDDVLCLLGGDDESGGVALAANDIALGSNPISFSISARVGGGEGGSAWMTEAPTSVRTANAMRIGVFMGEV